VICENRRRGETGLSRDERGEKRLIVVRRRREKDTTEVGGVREQ